MKIAIDIRTAAGERAGKGWYTFHIVMNLLKLDKSNEYLLYTKDLIPGFENSKNVKIVCVTGGGFFWHLNVARKIIKEKVDVFFAPSSYIIPAILPKNIKSIVTVHDLVSFIFPLKHDKKATIIERIFLKKAIKKADTVLAVSENTKKDVIEKFKIDGSKIKVVYCAAGENFAQVDSRKLFEFSAKTNLPKKFFLAVGTIEPRKNYTNLIKAFALLNKRFEDYNLVIVGKNGWDYEKVFTEIRKNYLHKKVHILGYLSEKSLINLYNLAAGLVFPSFYEGFGIPLLEAIKCSCPVIASNVSSIPEIVGDAGILISPESPEEIYSAMSKLVTNQKFREELKEKGLKRAKKFSWKLSSEKLFKIINNF